MWIKKRDKNSQPKMLEGAKSMGAKVATIASVGAVVGIGNLFSSLASNIFESIFFNPSYDN